MPADSRRRFQPAPEHRRKRPCLLQRKEAVAQAAQFGQMGDVRARPISRASERMREPVEHAATKWIDGASTASSTRREVSTSRGGGGSTSTPRRASLYSGIRRA